MMLRKACVCWVRLLCLGALLGVVTPAWALIPRVVVSINPFYGLVASVMQGVAVPTLLVKVGASPHEYTLKPSEIERLRAATLIFWGGPALESFLVKPLAEVQAKTVAFYQVPGLHTLPLRHSAVWESEGCAHHHSDQGTIDMHFWLSFDNAMAMTQAIVSHLSAIDPEHQSQYQANGARLLKRLQAVDRRIANNLREVQSMPYVVFHDAYQYFEQHYHLRGVGAISLHPELPPSAKRLKTIRAMIAQEKGVCLFSEPQFNPALVESIAADLPVKTGVLDPIGTASTPEGYFELMENLSQALKACLEKEINP